MLGRTRLQSLRLQLHYPRFVDWFISTRKENPSQSSSPKTCIVDKSKRRSLDTTAGTEFMESLSEALQSFILYKLHTDARWQYMRVVFSGPEVGALRRRKAKFQLLLLAIILLHNTYLYHVKEMVLNIKETKCTYSVDNNDTIGSRRRGA